MPLTATIAPAQQRGDGRLDGGVAIRRRRARRVTPRDVRAAHRAGVGLGVEPAVGRIVVLGLARRAHHEPGHRRARAVVRNATARSCTAVRSSCSS